MHKNHSNALPHLTERTQINYAFEQWAKLSTINRRCKYVFTLFLLNLKHQSQFDQKKLQIKWRRITSVFHCLFNHVARQVPLRIIYSCEKFVSFRKRLIYDRTRHSGGSQKLNFTAPQTVAATRIEMEPSNIVTEQKKGWSKLYTVTIATIIVNKRVRRFRAPNVLKVSFHRQILFPLPLDVKARLRRTPLLGQTELGAFLFILYLSTAKERRSVELLDLLYFIKRFRFERFCLLWQEIILLFNFTIHSVFVYWW